MEILKYIHHSQELQFKQNYTKTTVTKQIINTQHITMHITLRNLPK